MVVRLALVPARLLAAVAFSMAWVAFSVAIAPFRLLWAAVEAIFSCVVPPIRSENKRFLRLVEDLRKLIAD